MEVCVVFDIGKTNKKAFVFSQKYEVLWQETIQIEEILDEDGDHCDDLLEILNWIQITVKKLKTDSNFTIKAINFSTYGASLVYVDKNGKPLAPIYNYLKIFPKNLKSIFDSKYNLDGEFFLETASPDMGMLNSGLQAFWLKNNKIETFKNTRFALHLPQYISFIFTNNAVADFTSIGCHTGLWDFEKMQYHNWLEKEHLKMLSLDIKSASSTENVDNIEFGIGIHDSSAALVPYLKCIKEPFLLISTGTWSVSMNPFNSEGLTKNELENDCLQYLTYEGKPVKSSRIFSGNEHERHVKHLAAYFEKPIGYFKTVAFNAETVKTLRKKNIQIMPKEAHLQVLMESQFVERNLNTFASYEDAYHQLIMDLVTQQVASTQLVLNGTQIKQIIIEGGFANNSIFTKLFSEAFFHQKVYRSNLAQGSALGAAMVIGESWGAETENEHIVDLIDVL
jgi:L-fuculokinase